MALEHVKWKEAVAGAVSGALTVLLLHPLDVIKTRLQVQEKGISNRYHSTVHAFKTIKMREGVRGLYSGAHALMTIGMLQKLTQGHCTEASNVAMQGLHRR